MIGADGYIDVDGVRVIHSMFGDAGPLSEGLALTMLPMFRAETMDEWRPRVHP